MYVPVYCVYIPYNFLLSGCIILILLPKCSLFSSFFYDLFLDCTSWLDVCAMYWYCGTQYDRQSFRSLPISPCPPFPGPLSYLPQPGPCNYSITAQQCNYIVNSESLMHAIVYMYKIILCRRIAFERPGDSYMFHKMHYTYNVVLAISMLIL